MLFVAKMCRGCRGYSRAPLVAALRAEVSFARARSIFLCADAMCSSTTGRVMPVRRDISDTESPYSIFKEKHSCCLGVRSAISIHNTGGGNNTFTGAYVGASNTTGTSNTFEGYAAGFANLNGSNNTFLGQMAGYSNLTGNGDTFLGAGAGSNNQTGSNDIYIGNAGPSSRNESSTIRIGDPNAQFSAYVAGIYSSTSSSGIPVYINSNGQLGTQTSSRRFKEQIRDMGDTSSALLKLRPVTFLYKPEYDRGQRTLQYGLIAEEVAEVYPNLVAYEPNGKPYTVKYQYLTTMLLNEVQKQYRRAEEDAETIKSQEQRIGELEQRLSRLERLITNQETVIAQK